MAATTADALAKFIGKYDKSLIQQMLNGLDFVSQVRIINNASLNGTLLPKMTVAKGIRPLDLNIENDGRTNRSWSGRKLLVYPAMKIINMIPEELYNTFQSDMLKPGATQMPFAQWVWQREFEKIAQEINDSVYLGNYNGDAAAFNAASTYASGDVVTFGTYNDFYMANASTSAGESPTTTPAKWDLVNETVISTGWGTLIADEITGSNITPITTGALSSSNALDKIELMIAGMTSAHRKLGGIFYLSSDNFRNYLLHEQATYPNAANPSFGDGQKYAYGTNKKWEIQEATWMGDSGRVIATQKNNLAFGTNVLNDMAGVGKSIETLHGTKSVVKWLQGCEISDLETLYVNDQA